jgi:hypothetical protein
MLMAVLNETRLLKIQRYETESGLPLFRKTGLSGRNIRDFGLPESGFLNREKQGYLFLPESEYLTNLFPDEKQVSKPSEWPESDLIKEDIFHLHASFHFPEMMFVMPYAVWPRTLFINKVTTLNRLGNFGDPGKRNTHQRTYPVGDNHAGIHFRSRW